MNEQLSPLFNPKENFALCWETSLPSSLANNCPPARKTHFAVKFKATRQRDDFVGYWDKCFLYHSATRSQREEKERLRLVTLNLLFCLGLSCSLFFIAAMSAPHSLVAFSHLPIFIIQLLIVASRNAGWKLIYARLCLYLLISESDSHSENRAVDCVFSWKYIPLFSRKLI